MERQVATQEEFDPLRMEVIKNGLISITEEMSAALHRSAYSTNIKTRKDYSCGLFDSKLRTIAQSFSQPAHLGAMARSVPMALGSYGEEHVGKGDTIILNDPYLGASHLNDIVLISPIFVDNEKVGYVANMAHHVDIGGQVPASIPISKELYQEGIIIPPVKLFSDGKLNEDILRFITRNVRAKREVPGDLRAQEAANKIGSIRFQELLNRYGIETVELYREGLLDYTERRVINDLSKLPHGEYEGEDYLDDDGYSDEPIGIRVKVTINEGGFFCDFSGTDSQRKSPMNATLSATYAAVSYVVKTLISEDIPVNEGFYRCLNVKAPRGTVVNATEPSGVAGIWEVGQRIVSTLFRAVSNAVPERVAAASKGIIGQVAFGAYDRRKRQFYSFYETIGGGGGGREGKDGIDGVQADLTNTENAPIEEIEINYPFMIVRYELIPDSGGAGQWRGGLGIRRDYLFPDNGTTFTILSDRAKYHPWGILGGKDGTRSEYILNPESSDATELTSKCTFDLAAKDVVSFRTPGGGGYGDPFLRDPKKVLKDVILRKVSRERAEEEYGVVVTANNEINWNRTKELRQLREGNLNAPSFG